MRTGSRTASGWPGGTPGLDIALANLQAGFGQAFSGLQVTEHEVVEDGDALVIRGQNSGVHPPVPRHRALPAGV